MTPPVTRRGREVLPVGPFLDFCRRREAELRNEDIYPKISQPPPGDPMARLVESLGWDTDNGSRRLNRWRNPARDGHDGWVPRTLIEDAINCAGGLFHEIYPDAPPPPAFSSRFGVGRYLTDQQIIATHTLYVQGALTTWGVAELIWERFGYASPASAAHSILSAWRALGLPLRRCEAVVNGNRCQLHPAHGELLCMRHRKPGGWIIPTGLVAEARALHEAGASLNAVGRQLIDRTPWRNPHYLSCRLSKVAIAQGWHRSRHLGRRAREFQAITEKVST